MEGDDRPQWPWKVAALVNGRIRGKEILLSLCRRAHRDKAQCLHSFSVPIFLQPQVHGVMIWVQKELGLGPEQFPSHSFDLMHFSNKEVIKLIILSYDYCLALWMIMQVCLWVVYLVHHLGPDQNISKKLLDGLPWTFVLIFRVQRRIFEWLWRSLDFRSSAIIRSKF